MDEIIEQLIAEELAFANRKFPAFASTHEAWAVTKDSIQEVKISAVKCIKELIQVAAMCDKSMALEEPKGIMAEDTPKCKCGDCGYPMEQQGLDPAANTPIYRIECLSCHLKTTWHTTAICAWCEWEKLQNEKEESK